MDQKQEKEMIDALKKIADNSEAINVAIRTFYWIVIILAGVWMMYH